MATTMLGVRIDTYSKSEAIEWAEHFLASKKQHAIFTPNPETLVAAHRDETLKTILNDSSLNLCDGIGISLLSRTKLERIPGVDFMLEICRLAEQTEKSIYLLGSGSERVVQSAAREIRSRFPKLRIAGMHHGPRIDRICGARGTEFIFEREQSETLIHDIRQTRPDILFVAFGHGKQEYWIRRYLRELPSVKIAMGVGGSFDFLARKVRRAPVWLRNLGFEWLWRLVMEPRRIWRMFTAVFVFPFLYVINKK